MSKIFHLKNKFVPAVAVLLVMGTGIYMLHESRASVPSISLEAESGAGARVVTDANASGNKAASFSSLPADGGRVVMVDTSGELAAALAGALPGDTIQMADGTYSGTSIKLGDYYGTFGISRSGTAAAPITLTGSRNAIVDSGSPGSHYGLYIYRANHWNITGITVTNSSKGIVLDGSSSITLDGLRVYDIGSEAVHFRAFSSDNVIQNSIIEQTGLRQPQYGEGVYIGSANSNWDTYSAGKPDASNRNKVFNNIIRRTGAESIDIKEGTIDGVIHGNQFDGSSMKGENSADSWIDVKGNNYTVTNNTGIISSSAGTVFNNGFEVHQALSGWGNNNKFYNNVLDMANSTGGVTTTSGFGFYQQKGVTGNILSCNNTVKNAPKGFGVYNVSPQPCND